MPPLTGVPVPDVRGATMLSYAASADGGNLFTHTQGAAVSYFVVDWWPNMEFGGMYTCGSGGNFDSNNHINVCTQATPQVTRKILMTMDYWAQDTLTTFNPSGFEGCDYYAVSSVMDCTGAFASSVCSSLSSFNSRQCMSAVVSSMDSSTGMGTSGAIVFEPGFYTRHACSGDVEDLEMRGYVNVLLDSPVGDQDQWVDDPNVMRNFINQLNVVFGAGGWPYSWGLLNSPTPTFSTTAANNHWDGSMLC